jgi:hypothetical protein
VRRFLDDGRLRLDIKLSEIELRRQVVGRHDWTFCVSEEDAEWNATATSLIAGSQLHGMPWLICVTCSRSSCVRQVGILRSGSDSSALFGQSLSAKYQWFSSMLTAERLADVGAHRALGERGG